MINRAAQMRGCASGVAVSARKIEIVAAPLRTNLLTTSASAELFPVIDKLSSDRCGETILVKALHHSLARRLEDNSSVLQRGWTAVFGYRRRLIAGARLVEI